jgi:hypothetical protein
MDGATYSVKGNGEALLKSVGIGVNATISTTYTLNVVGDIYASGDIAFLSDINHKKNIKPLESQLSKIKRLNPVSFDWKESGKEDFGLIAQEVEEIYPKLVKTNEHGIKSVNYVKLSVLLLKALQEIKQ